MTSSTKITAERFEEIKTAIEAASLLMMEITKEGMPNLPYDCKLGVALSPNKMWVKVFKYDVWPGMTDKEAIEKSRSAWAFCDAEGKLWKAAGWSAPAKNGPRGLLSYLTSKDVMKAWQYSVR